MADKPKIVLVGLGPYSAATYLPFLRKMDNLPHLIVELDTAKESTERTLSRLDLRLPVFYLQRADFNDGRLTPRAWERLSERVSRAAITHAIIATEPRAHLGYLKFFIAEGIHCLTEKPLTAEVSTSVDVAKAMKLKQDYSEIAAANAANPEVKVALQVQRRFHPGYVFVREQIARLSKRFNVPVTHIDLFNSDGSWSMPNELISRENHSYKNGYGELLHSGYHFVDLLNWMRSAAQVSEDKTAISFEVQSVSTRPADQLQVLDSSFYKEHLGSGEAYENVYEVAERGELKSYGELDIYALIQFRRSGKTITTASLNLLSSGFSGRAWNHLPENTFKGNGRLSHERMTIHFGPLASILIERYQSPDEPDHKASEDEMTRLGGRDHFDVTIFQNSGITGGPRMVKYSIRDIMRLKELPYWSEGASSFARFESLANFLSQGPSRSDLFDHEDSIELLSALSQSIALHDQGRCTQVRSNLRSLT